MIELEKIKGDHWLNEYRLYEIRLIYPNIINMIEIFPTKKEFNKLYLYKLYSKEGITISELDIEFEKEIERRIMIGYNYWTFVISDIAYYIDVTKLKSNDRESKITEILYPE